MRIIVFGGGGFLGSHVADVLSNAGHKVVIYDIHSSPYLREDQEEIIGDILDEEKVYKSIKGCEIVYNFAGIADIDECVVRPVDTVRYNVLGNSIILEGARVCYVKRYIFASSAYVYSEAGSFYRSSKQACELFIESYHHVYNMPYTILRYGSLYGERADERNSIYRIIKEAMERGKIIYYGTGEEKREYIHVRDAAMMSLNILSEEFENQHVILTGMHGMEYRELLEMIKEILGNRIEIEYRERKSETHYQITPYSFNPKLGKKLICNPYIDMGQGLLSCMREIYKTLYKGRREEMGLLVEQNLP